MYTRIDERALDLWDKLYSLQMIADVLGVTRQGIRKFLIRHGVDTSKRKFEVECSQCGEKFSKHRCQIRKNRFNYCSKACYIKSMYNPDYNPNRQGQRIARYLVHSLFPLDPDNVVHHKDSNTANNDPSNLMVFRNHGDHMRWHRGDKSLVKPLWDGGVKVEDPFFKPNPKGGKND